MAVLLLSLLFVDRAAAVPGPGKPEPQVAAGNEAFTAAAGSALSGSDSSVQTLTSTDPIVDSFTVPVCALGGAQTCGVVDTCDSGDIMTLTTYVTASGALTNAVRNCPVAGEPPQQAEVSPGMVAAAFRRIPLPASELVVQPPGGRTLVNFETNFYTEPGEFMRTVRLLGRRVELRIWPVSFGWRFGDGETRRTTEPGARYPDLEVTHRYLSRGRVSPSVDTTYAAEFRVGGGPWRAVNGTVTIPGTPEGLRVVTARPVLVGSGSH
ncbi:hypothetical protein [Nocardioides pyridinolyticus]